MYCKNCGTRLNDNAKVCPNCGTFIDDGSGYTLLTSDDRFDDFYSSEPPKPEKKKSGALAYVISLILVLAIVGGGAYFYFTHIKPQEKPAPEVEFSTGCGIINETQPVIYLTVNNSDIQYIHGVTLYEYNKDNPDGEKKLISSDYEYTKNIDNTFRAIFFDTSEFGLKNGKTYNYMFEVKFAFIGSDDIFTYTEPIKFKGGFNKNKADVIFDHAKAPEIQNENGKEVITEEQTTTITQKKTNTSFIYESYWFTKPYTEGDLRVIFAFKFNKDNTYVSTKYEKNGSADWKVTTYNGKFKIEDGYVVASDSDGGEKTYYKIGDSSLTEELDGETIQKLTSRKYNSVKNAEDFFGL